MPPANPSAFAHLVFVDFENVPTVDLAPVAGLPVHVTLLIGERQRRLELGLVRQIHQHAAQVTLVEVGTSGRNALDLVLACHLGKAAERQPAAAFYIVSRDRDFDPLISHLRSGQLAVSRHDSFADLPCLAPAGDDREPGRRGSDRLAKVVATLEKPHRSRPKRMKSLLAHINALFGNTLSEPELNDVVAELVQRGILRVDGDKIAY
jgi:hypothetical protein